MKADAVRAWPVGRSRSGRPLTSTVGGVSGDETAGVHRPRFALHGAMAEGRAKVFARADRPAGLDAWQARAGAASLGWACGVG